VKYSIIIPTFNHLEDCLKPCIESIIKYTDLSNTEVIVVANGCNDGTHEYVESLGDSFRLIILPEASGYAKPTNLGIKAATGDHIVLLNNDTVILGDTWLDILYAPFVEQTIGIVGPLQQFSPAANHHFIVFFLVMIAKSVFEQIGYLDEEFYSYGEDTDFCIRATQHGFQVKTVMPYQKSSQFADGINRMVGQFPIYHAGNVSHKDTSDALCSTIRS